jgi:AcrR family transcriptional regulator
MNEEDLRVKRTRSALQKALVELVIEGDYGDVSVRAITKRAKVGYQTFYRHYQGKEDLLEAVFGDILDKFQTVLLPPTSPEVVEQNTINLYHFAHQQADLLKALLRSPMADQFMQPRILALTLAEARRTVGPSHLPDELMATHFATGTTSLIRWWLENDMPYPPDEMAEYVNEILIRPLFKSRSEEASQSG